MGKYLDDILVILGCICLVVATALWSEIGAFYVSGVLLIGGGVVVGLGDKRGKK